MRDLLEGRLLLATGDAAAALREFESGLRLWPDNSTARFLAGQAAEQLGDFDRAIEEYREAIRKRQDTGETDAALYLAQILYAKGTPSAAFSPLHRFIGTQPRREDALILMIHIGHKLEREKLIAQGLSRLVGAGKPGLAMEQHITILAADSGAEAAIEMTEKSGLDFDDPANVVALRALIEQLAILNRHEEARERVSVALAVHPDSADLYALSGRASLAAEGKAEEASAAFQRALQLEPEHPKALIGLAELAAASGATAEAIDFYDRAHSADPDDPSASRAVVALLQAADQYEQREERLAAMVSRDPRDSFAANEMAKSLAARRADLDRALSYARRAAFFETPREGRETLGWVHLLRGEYSIATEVLQAVVDSQPEATSARYRLGLAQKGAGALDRARESFEAVLAAGGAESQEARSEIARMDSATSL
jgi:tetratricopeptide (TPR) repeat protein